MAWAEHIDVVLRPNELRLERRSKLTPWRSQDARVFNVAPVASGEAWRASIERLAPALRDMRVRRARLHVVVSDHFVRYALTAWNANLVADSERLAFARVAYRNIYGSPADTWDLCLDQQPAGQASLVAAMDRGLVQALRDAAAGQGTRLGSVIPALAARINRHRALFKGTDFCLATAEPGRLTLAFHAASGWVSVRSRRMDGSLAQELPAALKQEAAASAIAEGGSLYLAAEELAGLGPFSVPGWRVIRLAENSVRPAAPAVPFAPAPMVK
jgi:hypothetical protein